ncbi:hypothetical protein THRCLA_22827 [Thraustotheca clavata]|uniref:Uncharacterized protein n=1 Tax=Thraustotheca clavata TaxID=74557 RepID=A0A1V9YSA9_9STRA|nr:hypothetical protein THRCLA_22827 [Thraustotheca clavata]
MLYVKEMPACLLYKEEGDGATIKVENTFAMLDSLIEMIRNEQTTTTIRVDNRFDDRLEDYTTRTVQTHYLTTLTDICHPQYQPRPCFCELPWFNFESLGYNGVSIVSSHIASRMNNTLTILNQTNQRLDIAVIEATMHKH